jgi:hypothetical protein
MSDTHESETPNTANEAAGQTTQQPLLPAFDDQTIYDLAVPTMSEKYILAAAGQSSNITTYELHQVLTLQKEDVRGEFSPAELELRNHYHRHLHATYGIDADPVTPESARVFENPFVAGRTLVITDPGALQYAGKEGSEIKAGNVIMVETPSRRLFDNLYRDGFETMLPSYVIMRAQIRMKVAQTDKALVYVVGDNHDIDEFHVVLRDDKIISDLEQACRRAIQRVIDNDPPKPDITEDHLLVEIREGNAPLVVSADDNYFPMVKEMLDAIIEEKRLYEPYKTAKDLATDKKKEVEALMADNDTNKIIMPDGAVITRKLVKKKESYQAASSYTQLNVKKAG